MPKLDKEQFEYLMSLSKQFKNTTNISLPAMQSNKVYDLISSTSLNEFYLDYDRRGSLELKHKVQLRDKTYTANPLIRLEINTPPHINPDGKILSRNHIHIYHEIYGDSMAYELSDILPKLNRSSPLSIFTDFCVYCNIIIDTNLQEVF